MTRINGGIQPISVVAAPDQRVLTVHLDGALDIATIGTCRARLNEALATVIRPREASGPPNRQPKEAVLDLSELTFLSAAGLRMLSDTAYILAEHGIKTVLVVPPGSLIRRLVGLAGLDRSTTIVDPPYPDGRS